MKPRIAWVLLAASIGFNVFYAVGYYRAKATSEALQSFEGRARVFAQALELDASQREVFERMLAQASRARMQSKQRALPATEAFLEELSRPEPDEAKLLEHAARDANAEYRQTTVLMMRDFMKVLGPEQRRTFIQAIRQRASGS